ncbi:SHOCT domain-containing protein [Sulfurovum sp.]|uniref:SHOCT domain-containing protein n=1 Tax=Sulfurovum sp. TaxID=1969726 RepID=UPI003563060A
MSSAHNLKAKISLFALLSFIFLLNGCSTKFTTTESENGTILYKLEEKEAFKIAHHSMLNVLPGRKITIIDGPTKGYSTYFRSGLDTYSQQILVFPASGIDQSGNKVSGYYYEVSGSGSSFVQGRAKNVSLYETLNKKLQETNSGVIVTNLKNEKYSSTISGNFSEENNEAFDNLERLKELYDKGILTEEEYKNKKAELLEKI